MVKWRILLIVLVLFNLILSGCGAKKTGDESPVLSGVFAKGLNEKMGAVVPGNHYEIGENVYLSVTLNGAPRKGQVAVRFMRGKIEVAVQQANLAKWLKEHPKATDANGNLVLGFALEPAAPLVAGQDYSAELALDGKVIRTFPFTIGAPTPVPPTKAPAVVEPTKPASSAPAGAVTTLADVKKAVVQIEAQGSFVHPQLGQMLNAAGQGSGFIIDPSGIAITNNHVASGAAFLKVWVAGDTTPKNAKILGVSECSDLAVIDIEGEGYSYLQWYDGPISVGLEIYVAGFPLGDPEYTLVQGIVSKERAAGETSWASVDRVIEHTAPTLPGDSGGPVITKDGQVLAVNYAASEQQRFAIGRDEALPIIAKLRAGADVNALGVNGEAVSDNQGLTGIWVSSVQSGSPADKAGVKAGDIIVKLEGLVLATDGTLSDYCDILRTHDPDDTLGLEVLRYATQEMLEGQINGRELAPSFSLSQRMPEEPVTATEDAYTGYQTLVDDSESLTVDVPVEWNDVITVPFRDDQGLLVGAYIAASADLDRFMDTWGEPGMYLLASTTLAQDKTLEEILDGYDFSTSCDPPKRYTDYDDSFYTGVYDIHSKCGSANSDCVVLAAEPADKSFVIVLLMTIVSGRDTEALDKIIDSFQVVGTLPTE